MHPRGRMLRTSRFSILISAFSYSIRLQLRALGVPDHATIMENDSRNTRQNALFVAELAASLGVEHVLLVTSAWHMPRAAATFGRTGCM